MLGRVYSCQNATLLIITKLGSNAKIMLNLLCNELYISPNLLHLTPFNGVAGTLKKLRASKGDYCI